MFIRKQSPKLAQTTEKGQLSLHNFPPLTDILINMADKRRIRYFCNSFLNIVYIKTYLNSMVVDSCPKQYIRRATCENNTIYIS